MKWQKAKSIVRQEGPSAFLNDKELWVQVGPPNKGLYGRSPSGEELPDVTAYYTNYLADPTEPSLVTPYCLIQSDEVELLARGPEDFAEDVPLIPFEEWAEWAWEGEE